MPAYIVVRHAQDGTRRYHVRARIGGRHGRVIHLGVFKNRHAAEECRSWANVEEANGRIPDRRARLASEIRDLRTLRQAALEWAATLVDLAENTRRRIDREILRGPAHELWETPLNRLAEPAVQAYIIDLADDGYKPSTIRGYITTIRQALDHAGIDPNPARAKLRYPRIDAPRLDPPSADEVAAILRVVTKRYQLPVALLEATGLRVTELCTLAWGDVDVAGSRFRIARGKTSSARRFVPVPPELMALVEATLPLEDRTAQRLVFPGMRREAVGTAMARACRHAGIPLYSPHDLRHRYISRLVQFGVPITRVQEIAGHARASLTWDVYSHTLTDESEGWREVLT